uniref:Uncharacterized protein n=1 Tax=Steinernema glaseri TaxID=37863 RepID=A0A1I8AN27_9BILA
MNRENAGCKRISQSAKSLASCKKIRPSWSVITCREYCNNIVREDGGVDCQNKISSSGKQYLENPRFSTTKTSAPSGLEPPTFRLTAERANQLRHGSTPISFHQTYKVPLSPSSKPTNAPLGPKTCRKGLRRD